MHRLYKGKVKYWNMCNMYCSFKEIFLSWFLIMKMVIQSILKGIFKIIFAVLTISYQLFSLQFACHFIEPLQYIPTHKISKNGN